MASKDGRIPGYKVKQYTSFSDDESAALEKGSSPAGNNTVATIASKDATPKKRKFVRTQTPPSTSPIPPRTSPIIPPDFTPEVWARKLLVTVNDTNEYNTAAESSSEEDDAPCFFSSATDLKRASPILQGALQHRPTPTRPTPQPSSARSLATSSELHKRRPEATPQQGPLPKKARQSHTTFNSWDSLLLGRELGSVALNRALAKLHPQHESPQLTSLQTLQIVHSLRLETIVPPATSLLHKVIQTVSVMRVMYV